MHVHEYTWAYTVLLGNTSMVVYSNSDGGGLFCFIFTLSGMFLRFYQ